MVVDEAGRLMDVGGEVEKQMVVVDEVGRSMVAYREFERLMVVVLLIVVTLEIERLMMMAVGRQKLVTGEVEWLMVEIF